MKTRNELLPVNSPFSIIDTLFLLFGAAAKAKQLTEAIAIGVAGLSGKPCV